MQRLYERANVVHIQEQLRGSRDDDYMYDDLYLIHTTRIPDSHHIPLLDSLEG